MSGPSDLSTDATAFVAVVFREGKYWDKQEFPTLSEAIVFLTKQFTADGQPLPGEIHHKGELIWKRNMKALED